MEQLNRVELRGLVGSIKRQTYADKEVANIHLGTSRAYRDKSGSAIIETTWHNVVVWDIDKYPGGNTVDKGTKLYVCGRIRTQKYTKENETERVQYDIIANQMAVIQQNDPLQYEM